LPSFLEAWGVSRVDRVFLSHPHADHYGGLSDLLGADVPVSELVLGVPEDDPGADPGFRDLVDGLRRAGTRVRPPPACGPLHVEGLDAVLVHPCGGDIDDARIDVNDRSAVMAFRHGRVCILFTGDIGSAVEADVAARVPFDCTVLKVPHHGSRGSSSLPLLSVPGLEWAVVSARRGNRHGLPHREALARIRSAGLGILRVDLDGGWTVVTDGRSLGMLPADRWNFSSISRI
jgi:competence protein ComEC